MSRCVVVFVCALLLLVPVTAHAQQGQIAGVVRDGQGAVMPGVTVEATSPALIEKVRSATTDAAGQYRITNLPVGTYSVSFTLEGFGKQQRDNIVLTTGFTAPVNVTLTVGQLQEAVTVTGETPTVDVQNARQVAAFEGEEIRDLPTTRNIRSVLTLTPGLTATGLGADCVGGVGVWCNNNIYNLSAHTARNDTEGGAQGRVMVDGTIINTGGGAGIMGMTGGYVADVANAQEVTVQISGALGESETGGASINIVPRTGGNRFSGNYFVTYTRSSWFDDNFSDYPELRGSNAIQPLLRDYDTSGAFGGPIKRDRLWFFSVARAWQKNSFSRPVDRIWDNANAGIWGQNYQPDRTQEPLQLINWTRNANARITAQASQKNKFNFFWDEGYTCQDPCDGSVAPWTARDGWWSGQVHPARLIQVGWTNPLTNVILLEAGLSANRQLYDFSQHRYFKPNADIPRVVEFGTTVGATADFPVLNSTNFNLFGVPSGPWSDGIGGAAEQRQLNDWRPRASFSYVTGTHSAKFGYDGGYFAQTRSNRTNSVRLEYRYDTPAAGCFNTATPSASTCGNTSLYHANDPFNQARRPVPTRVKVNSGPSTIDNRVAYSGFYAQDQWTLKRLTLSGAVRYDHATSNYPETCIGTGGNRIVAGGNEPYVPVQVGGAFAGQRSWCTPETEGVSYHNVTPRWAVAWDVFGNGKTAVKFNMGKYLAGAGISGIYADANPAQRSVNTYTRTWTDVDGDRVVDCNLLNFAEQNVPGGDICGGPSSVPGQDSVRYGRDPLSLDAAGTPIGLGTTQCGRREAGIPVDVQNYCDVYGESLLDGWGRRRSEWQLALGIQQELLPRFSAEVTYNRKSYSNLTVSDTLGIGCDRFNGVQATRACQDGFLNFTSPDYGFFTAVAPTNPGLPGGGGYVIRGLSNQNAVLPVGRPSAVTIMDELSYISNFVDTNFVWRGTDRWKLRGLRINGGTTTGRAVRDECYTMLDGPNVRQHEGVTPSCNPYTRWETSVRGTAAYTIPKVDVLVSTVFARRLGPERSANHAFTKDEVTWEPSSAARATAPCPAGATAGQVGCFTAGANVTATTYTVNMLNPGELYGPGYTIFDLKLGKNIRFAGRRLNVGVDIYNLFNNDQVLVYQNNFDTADNPATTNVVEQWGQASELLTPRFVRLTVQFDF